MCTLAAEHRFVVEAKEHCRPFRRLRKRLALVGETARVSDAGNFELDATLLREAVSMNVGVKALSFGSRGCVNVRRLAAILRACRSVTGLSVVVLHDSLVLHYSTARARGRIKLVLHDAPADAFVVPLRKWSPRRVAAHAARAKHRERKPVAEASRSPRTLPSWIRRALDACAAYTYG